MAEIAIVGGGIAGLYCAWKLQNSHSVTLYECLRRLGGRIETHDLQGFKAECGPMRFELAIQPLFRELAETKLGIAFDDFTPPRSGPAKWPKYNLKPPEFSAKHKRQAEKRTWTGLSRETVTGIFSHKTSALDLLKFGIYRMLHQEPHELRLSLAEVVSGGARSKISLYARSLTDADYDRIRTTEILDGVLLYELGFWNALSRVLSPGAVSKIRDTGTFYHLMPENPSASEWTIFWLRLFRPDADLSTIKDGRKVEDQPVCAQLN